MKAPFKSPAQHHEQIEGLDGKLQEILVGIPARWVRSVGLILPHTSPELIPTMVHSQLERKGLVHDLSLGTSSYVLHHLGQSGSNLLLSVDLFQGQLPDELLFAHSVSYVPASRTHELPQNDLILLTEQRSVILITSCFGKVWSSCVLGDIDHISTRDLQRELRLAQFALESQDGFGSLRGVTLVGEYLLQHYQELSRNLDLPVQQIPKQPLLAANVLQQLPIYLPPSVRDTQLKKKRRKQYVATGFLTLVLYMILFAAAYLYLQNLQKKTAQLDEELGKNAVPASLVKEATQRWKALEASIDSQRYPIIQLAQINTILPPSGVLIKKYITKADEIEINGDSRDAQTATQLLEDLKKHPKLSRFEWSMPVPSVRNNVATFKIQGKLHGS